MPYENEQFLLEKSTEFITVVPPGNEHMLLKVYQIMLEILYDRRRFSEAERKIRQIRTAISRNRSPVLWGRLYYILAGFYDAKLSGAYDAQTAEEAQIVRLLLKSVNKAIHWLSVSNAGDSGILLGECYRLKALVLIRSGTRKKKQVWAILEKVRKQIDKYAQPNSKLVRDYDLTMAWYYTYLEENYPQTCALSVQGLRHHKHYQHLGACQNRRSALPDGQSDAGMAAIRSSGAVPAPLPF